MQNEISYLPNPSGNEVAEDKATEARASASIATEERLRPQRERAAARARREAEESALADGPELALFSLIADPKTIAGESAATPGPTSRESDAEIARLRDALHAREHELEALRQRVANPPPDAAASDSSTPVLNAESPRQAREKGLLGSAEARRMARQAREREQASRLALEAAQQARKTEERAPANADSGRPLDRGGFEQSWETLPLSVQKHALENRAALTDAAPPARRTAASEPNPARSVRPARRAHPARPTQAEVQLRAARAEVRELEATLSIARDTALTQKLEIARLRSELEAAPEHASSSEMAALEDAFRAVLPEEESIDVEAIRIEAQDALRAELAQELEATQSELDRMRERVAIGEREMETREAERRVLRETLAARETDLQSVRTELIELQRQLLAESEAARALQHSLDQERDRYAETQALLDQLRSALQLPFGEAAQPTGPREAIRVATPTPTLTPTPVDPAREPVAAQAVFESAAHDLLPSQKAAQPSPNPCEDAISGSDALFTAWQDDQVRRHFGPFGIDTARDLVMAPLERRRSILAEPARILVLGDHAETWAERLAEDLISNESPPFEILLGSEDAAERRTVLQDRPIDEFISATRAPKSPTDLETLLARIKPSVIISRNFLSRIDEVGEWLDVLRALPKTGPSLIFLESTGVGPLTPPDAMMEIGDRIWSLMPARYTREGDQDEARIESWHDAFCKMQPVPSNGLRAALREGFEIEIAAQFGFLTEPFLRSPVALNFDPNAQRDRRFLNQVADLDDRKIEAGLAPALHFVARIDGQRQD